MSVLTSHGRGSGEPDGRPKIEVLTQYPFATRLIISNPPPGMCPWGEANCDDGCGSHSGCKIMDRGEDYRRGAL